MRRLSEDFVTMSAQLNRVAAHLTEVEHLLTGPVVAAVPPPPPRPVVAPPLPPPPPWLPAPAGLPAPALRVPLRARLASDGGDWIGKLLAVAGVAVTLIGVVLLLVLAAQAGILRPEVRVPAGAALAGALVLVGVRWNRRPGGRTGAIALTATGIAAGYIDIMAVTTIYHWVPAPVALLVAAGTAGAGLTLAGRWDSEPLALLVGVPLLILAPIVAGGITLLLIGFMIALSAVALLVALGRDWPWLHAARTAAVSGPLLVALAALPFGTSDDPGLLGAASGVAALLAVIGAVLLAPSAGNRIVLALLTVAGTAPVLLAGITVERGLGALLTATLAAVLLAVVAAAHRLPGVGGPVAQIFSALAAVSVLIAVLVAFDGRLVAPVLLALAVTVAVAGRHSVVARWAAIGFTGVGSLMLQFYAPIFTLFEATPLPARIALPVLASAVLLAGCAVLSARSAPVADEDQRSLCWGIAAAVCIYAVTLFTVTAGVLIAGVDGGFLAGQMAATICWIVMAAALFAVAQNRRREDRAAPILGGLALTAAATTKLFLFDLGTLDGMFRVVAFIVVGLVQAMQSPMTAKVMTRSMCRHYQPLPVASATT